MIKLLKQEHNGMSGFESVILSPLIFMTLVVLLYLLFANLTYIAYNNIANVIAQDLNMRKNGYTDAKLNYKIPPNIVTFNGVISDNNTLEREYLDTSKIKVEPMTEDLKCGAYFALGKQTESFLIPYSQLEGITIKSSKKIDYKDILSKSSKASGAVITVEIDYSSINLNGVGLIKMKAIGYGVIA